MKNKKLLAAIVGALLVILGSVKAYLDTPDAPAPAPAASAASAPDAGK
jgi:hypothetical protein